MIQSLLTMLLCLLAASTAAADAYGKDAADAATQRIPGIAAAAEQLLPTPSPYAKAIQESRVSHELHYDYDFLGFDWDLMSRTSFSYDEMDRILEELDELWNEGEEDWNNQQRDLNTWNSSVISPVQTLQQDWVADDWMNSTQSILTLDGEGRPTIIVTQNWESDQWNNESRSSLSYGDLIEPVEIIVEIWTGDAWVDTGRAVLSYESGRIQEMVNYIKEGDSWQEINRTVYTYEGGLLMMHVMQNREGETWVDFLRTVYTYDGDLLVVQVMENWFEDVWFPSGRDTFSYDGEDRLIEEIHQSYLPLSGLDAADWSNSSKIEYYYETGAAVRQLEGIVLPDRVSLEQNYPNPFNPTTQIRFAIDRSGFVQLRVFDVLGRRVANLVNQELPAGTHEVEFDASDFAGGVYFYRLEVDDFGQTRKMLLLK
jgi:hypothetical protein